MPSKQRTRTEFLCLTISAPEGRYENSGANYRYPVTVDSDATGARVRFDYHDSQARKAELVDHLDRENLLYALRCFVDDATYGDEGLAEFCDNLGYDTDSIKARRIHEACKAARAKFDRLFSATSIDPAYVLARLADQGIE